MADGSYYMSKTLYARYFLSMNEYSYNAVCTPCGYFVRKPVVTDHASCYAECTRILPLYATCVTT